MPVRNYNWIKVLEAYKTKLFETCGVPVYFAPLEVSPERFHITLSALPHPVLIGANRVRLRLRASAGAEIPPSNRGISDALEISLQLAYWFGSEQGGIAIAPGVFAIAYHTEIRGDDELFTDLSDDRSYSYDEHWLVEIEFNYMAARNAVAQGE